MKTLNELTRAIHQNAFEKGFHSDTTQTPLQFAQQTTANIHGEVSEFWEAWRAGKQSEPCDKASKMIELGLPALTCQEEELADIIIRTLDTAARLNVDIQKAVEVKHAFNKTREHMHGKLA